MNKPAYYVGPTCRWAVRDPVTGRYLREDRLGNVGIGASWDFSPMFIGYTRTTVARAIMRWRREMMDWKARIPERRGPYRLVVERLP